jgi:hypothetical protein
MKDRIIEILKDIVEDATTKVEFEFGWLNEPADRILSLTATGQPDKGEEIITWCETGESLCKRITSGNYSHSAGYLASLFLRIKEEINNLSLHLTPSGSLTEDEMFDKIYAKLEDKRILSLLEENPKLDKKTAEQFWHLSKKESAYEMIELFSQQSKQEVRSAEGIGEWLKIIVRKPNITDVYLNGFWLKQVIPESFDIQDIINCVGHSLKDEKI